MVPIKTAENSTGTLQLPVGGKSIVQGQVNVPNALQVVDGQDDKEPVSIESIRSDCPPVDLGWSIKEGT